MEELDYDLKEESEKTIKPKQTKEFTYNWEPRLPGRHLLIIYIYDENTLLEHIESVIDVNTDILIKDKLAEVNILGDII